jgi:hypothetical protein
MMDTIVAPDDALAALAQTDAREARVVERKAGR